MDTVEHRYFEHVSSLNYVKFLYLQTSLLNVIADGGQRETIERTGNGRCVSSHILEYYHITDLHIRQMNTLTHLKKLKPKDLLDYFTQKNFYHSLKIKKNNCYYQ